jgi:hypothetical protein
VKFTIHSHHISLLFTNLNTSFLILTTHHCLIHLIHTLSLTFHYTTHHIFSQKTLFSHHISNIFHSCKQLDLIFTIHPLFIPPFFTNLNGPSNSTIYHHFTRHIHTHSLTLYYSTHDIFSRKKHYFRITSTPLFTHQPGLDGKFYAKNLLRFQLSLHHITLNTPKDMFGAVNVGKKY